MLFVIGILLFFVWLITAFVVTVDMFKRHTALGCVGLLTLPILPFYWVVRGYSGNRRIAGTILYASAVLASLLIGGQWYSASTQLSPFFDVSKEKGVPMRLNQIGTARGKKYYTVVSRVVYEPNGSYASVEEMLSVIESELIEALIPHVPEDLKEGVLLRIAIPTPSGFVAVYEVSGQTVLKRYTASMDSL